MGRENLRCRRCYRILHYGQRDEGGGSREDHLAAIRRGIREAGLVVMVFDLVDFEGSWSEEINSLVGTKPLLAVLNKSDLLPRQVKPEEAEIWAGNRLQELGREPVAVIPVSSTRGWGIKRLLGGISAQLGNMGKAVLVGATNVGKSSLLNALERRAGEGVQRKGQGHKLSPVLTTSPYPGTTQDLVLVDLPTAGCLLIDTPGLSQPGRLSDILCPDCSRRLIPAGELSRKTYKVSPGQTLLFGGLARYTIVAGAPRPILIAFAAREVVFHVTKRERVDHILTNHSGEWLVPPCKGCRVQEWEEKALTAQEGQDIVVPGLGWVTVRRGPVELEVAVPKGVKVKVRPALIRPRD
ncbi:MAG: GTPase [bacterium]|jgi:ribosome biogenesis GTPase A